MDRTLLAGVAVSLAVASVLWRLLGVGEKLTDWLLK